VEQSREKRHLTGEGGRVLDYYTKNISGGGSGKRKPNRTRGGRNRPAGQTRKAETHETEFGRDTCINKHTYTHTIYLYLCICIYIHIHIHMYIYICMSVSISLSLSLSLGLTPVQPDVIQKRDRVGLTPNPKRVRVGLTRMRANPYPLCDLKQDAGEAIPPRIPEGGADHTGGGGSIQSKPHAMRRRYHQECGSPREPLAA